MLSQFRWVKTAVGLGLILVLPLFNGCAQTQHVLRYDSAGSEGVVWPPPPEQARYRFVGQLTGEENFGVSEDDNEFFGVRAVRWLVGLVAGKRIPSILQRPQGGMVDSAGRVYVTDVSRQAVCVFDPAEGKFLVWEMARPDMPFRMPIGITEGPNDEVWVTDSELAMVARLDKDGVPLGTFGEGVLVHPTGIARDPANGWVYVADTRVHAIKVFDDSGNLLKEFGVKGEDEGKLNSPTYLVFANGELYVSDTLNSRVQVFDPDGNIIRAFGRRGLFVGDLPRPKGVAVDNNGLIYVVESFYDYLLVFNDNGQFLLPIGGTGKGIGQFYLPAGVWTDKNNLVYVADMFNGRVVVLEFLGEGA